MSRYAAIAGFSLALGFASLAISAEVTHVSGGIGETEQESLRAQEKNYNLKLVFTLNEGNYLADVGVEVKDAAGKAVVTHVARGPFFLAKLSPGQYAVTATYEGRSITRNVRVAASGLRTEHLRWPSNPATDFVGSRSRE